MRCWRTLCVPLLLLGCLALYACAAPTTLVEQSARSIERFTAFELLPALPVDLIAQVVAALDQGDLAAARALFAPDAPRRDLVIAHLRTHWPGRITGQADAVMSVGPYQSRDRLVPVPLGTRETIPVQLHCTTGSLEAQLVVQMTSAGWRLYDMP